jgi:TetR/AcrR family transcriptional regulator, transcriptional repressor for nem operon
MGRPKEFDRNEVLGRALDVFWANGYEATSLNDLTRAMKLGRGSLYNEFGDKHSLFIEALDRYRRERLSELEAALAKAPSVRAGIAAVLRGTVKRLWADETRRGCLMVNSAAELASTDPAVASRAEDAFARHERVFRSALERGKRSGEFDGDLDVLATSRYLANAALSLRLLSKMTDRRVADDVLEVTLKALD